MRFGVCYYPEHWPEARWAIDAEMMVRAGLDIVRIAEFSWAKMEPQAGQYDWGWLDKAIAVLSSAGLDVVLGTPTATPPIWLTRNYPDILRRDANGRFRAHGSRRQYCPNSPRYIAFSRQITTALAERYGKDDRIIGWQVDNEFGGGKTARCYCENCSAAFSRWLAERYGTISALNEAWGNIFWSQNYQNWEQILPPDDSIDKSNPSHALDFYRFSSDSYVTYQQYQIDILRELAPNHFITTNFMGLYADLDQFDLAAPYDFITWDNYPTGNFGRWEKMLSHPSTPTKPQDSPYAYDVGDPLITGMAHELTRALKQKPFWIMEQQPGHINWGENNPAPRDGTVRLWSWQAMAAGANTVVYFRWRPTLYAHEQYHAGLLRHDGETAVGYHDLLTLRDEKELMTRISAVPHEAQVALLFNYDDLWALQLQPHAVGFSYLGLHYAYYQALHRLGIPVHFVHERDDFTSYPLVIAPTAHLADDTLAAKLRGYAEAGGAVLLGIRSGFKTTSNLVTPQKLPGVFRELVGATAEEWQGLLDGVSWDFDSDIPELAGPATYWVEALTPDTAESLATYKNGFSALTVNEVGQGKIYYFGFYPEQEQVQALINHLTHQLDIPKLVDFPPGIVAYSRGIYTILMNFSDHDLKAIVDGIEILIPGRNVVVQERH